MTTTADDGGNVDRANELRRDRLPQTGTSLPLIGLIGVLALTGAAGLRLSGRS